MGLLGLFTNKKERLLQWQNVVCQDKSHRLYMTESQLVNSTIQSVRDSIRIFDDCSSILNNTVKPDVFFSRLALAEEKLVLLVSLEPYMATIKQITMNELPSSLLRTFQGNKDRYICDFIYRYYWSVQEKAEKMKTEKGKQNQYLKFYESLEPYFDQISEHNMKYVEAMRQQKI